MPLWKILRELHFYKLLFFFPCHFLSSQQVSLRKIASSDSKTQCVLKHMWLNDNTKYFFILFFLSWPKSLICSVPHITQFKNKIISGYSISGVAKLVTYRCLSSLGLICIELKRNRGVFVYILGHGEEKYNNINRVNIPSYACCVCLLSFLPTLKFINRKNTEFIGCNTSIVEIRLLLSTTCSGTNPSSFSSSSDFSLHLTKDPQNCLWKQMF